MAPWNSSNFFPSTPQESSSPFGRPHGGRPGGGPHGRGGPTGRRGGGRGRRSAVVERERLRDEPNPFELDHMVEKFDELEVIEDSLRIANSSGINFDAYEDIPVEVSGQNVPPSVNTFAEIDLGEALNDNIRRCKYVKPTPIQRHAIPIAIAGRDLMACAQTGSGKTAAFCFPIIAGILTRGVNSRASRMACPIALILAPTRELSSQINEEAKKFAYQTGVKVVATYGGAPMSDQLRQLQKGVHILVATPGRLLDMIERGKISLCMIRYLALDEADRMLDMGFEPQIRKIVQQTDMPPPGARQTLLFSATFPTQIQRLASDFLSNYIFLTVGRVGSSTDLIIQKVELVYDADKKRRLKDLLSQKINGTYGKHVLTIVFVETKRGADGLQYWLSCNGFPATAIHGDKVQVEREMALKSFKSGATPIMVATDVAARGLDIPCVAHVINFDLPRDIDAYVHRIGRTGRAGKSGLATAFFNDKNLPIAKPLADLMAEANQEVPSWLTEYGATSSSFGYGGGRFRGSKFGSHDFRRFDHSPAVYSDYSSPFAGEVAGASVFGTDSSVAAADTYDSPACDEVPSGFACGTDSSIAAADPSASMPLGFTHGYESIVATGWD